MRQILKKKTWLWIPKVSSRGHPSIHLLTTIHIHMFSLNLTSKFLFKLFHSNSWQIGQSHDSNPDPVIVKQTCNPLFYHLVKSSHRSILQYFSSLTSQASWSLSTLTLGERRDTPWTGCQSIVYINQWAIYSSHLTWCACVWNVGKTKTKFIYLLTNAMHDESHPNKCDHFITFD